MRSPLTLYETHVAVKMALLADLGVSGSLQAKAAAVEIQKAFAAESDPF